MRRTTLFAVALSLIAQLLYAQTAPIVNPGAIEFLPAPDYNNLDANGKPIVTSVRLEIFEPNTTVSLVTKDLGKPVIGLDGLIRTSFFPSLDTVLKPNTTYVAKISAIGPGGVTASAESNTFSTSTLCSLTLDTSSYAANPFGGMGSVNVISTDSCAWKATTTTPWLRITNPVGLIVGSAPTVFSADINSTFKPRAGSILIGQSSVGITQDAFACTYTVDPPTIVASSNISVRSASVFTWTNFSTDRRALQTSSGGTRTASAWYGDAFSVDIPNVGLAQRLALYVVDFDAAGRQERIDIVNDAGAVIASQMVTDFASGKYLFLPVTGHVSVRVTKLVGPNAVLSGVFLDSSAQSTASSDTITGGDWTGKYGSTIYAIAGDVTNSLTVGFGGGTATIAVRTQSVCNWTVVSNASWLAASTSASTGDGIVTLTFPANTTTTARSATVTVAGQQLSFTQLGAPQPPVDKCGILGGEGITLTILRYNMSSTGKPGSLMDVDYIVSSRSNVNEISVFVDGTSVVYAGQRNGLVSLNPFSSIKIPTPNVGNHVVSMKASNLYGCTGSVTSTTQLRVK